MCSYTYTCQLNQLWFGASQVLSTCSISQVLHAKYYELKIVGIICCLYSFCKTIVKVNMHGLSDSLKWWWMEHTDALVSALCLHLP